MKIGMVSLFVFFLLFSSICCTYDFFFRFRSRPHQTSNYISNKHESSQLSLCTICLMNGLKCLRPFNELGFNSWKLWAWRSFQTIKGNTIRMKMLSDIKIIYFTLISGILFMWAARHKFSFSLSSQDHQNSKLCMVVAVIFLSSHWSG